MHALIAANAGSSLWQQFLSQAADAFLSAPHIFMAFASMVLAAVLVAAFWVVYGIGKAGEKARQSLRANALRKAKDHRALIIVGRFEGIGGNGARDTVMAAIERHFGDFAFNAPVQVEAFPAKLPVAPETAQAERQRRIAADGAAVMESCAGEVMVWGRKHVFSDRLDIRIVSFPGFNKQPEIHALTVRLSGKALREGLEEAIAYAVARRARPVLNRPHDYKPEKLQPIVESLERFVEGEPEGLSHAAYLELLSDFAAGSLSLGERGGQKAWLEKAYEARLRFLRQVNQSDDPGAWGASQLELGRALSAIGEREGAKDKLHEALAILVTAKDALLAADSLQNYEIAKRAIDRTRAALDQRNRIGLKWPAATN